MLTRQGTMVCVGVALGALTMAGASGCLQRELAPLNPCLVSGVTEQVKVNTVDKVDLLFMVDNSSSMEDKQKNLRLHVPDMVKALVNGKRGDNDPHPFPPVKDLHIAVVDCDMGLVGVSGIPGCVGFGHDGNFQNTPHASTESPTCDASYPPFLTYSSPAAATTADPVQVAKLQADFGCIANVGDKGCGFEQQLEAVLKALWPAKYVDPATGKPAATNPITFLTDKATPAEAFGHGDGTNANFQRNNAAQGLSLLVIIVLSDEDDGSTGDMGLYAPTSQAPSWLDPQTVSNYNLRPLIGQANRDHLYPVSRYINGFLALRPGNPQLVVYAAITGVPVDLVDANATAIDFANQGARDAFYDTILADPRMQNVIDPASDTSDRKVKYACDKTFGHAYPGRRYVEVAKGIGENATIYSICEDDYTPALNNVINIIAKQLSAVCLPKPLVRDAIGQVKCNVVWELPNPSTPHSNNTPIACGGAGFQFLKVPTGGHLTTTPAGGAICIVDQLPVVSKTVPTGDGWYYDDFSTEVQTTCPKSTPQRVSFSTVAKPPNGVTVKLECLNETQKVVTTRTDIAQGAVVPTIGTSCEAGADGAAKDALCAVPLINNTQDNSMFCYLKTNTCVKQCTSDLDCPPAWVCDKRDSTLAATKSDTHPTGSFICANPTCGTGE